MRKYRFNTQTLKYEIIERPKYYKQLRVALMALAAVGMVVLYFWIYTSVLQLDLPRTAILKKQHADWENKVNVLNRRLDVYENTLVGIEQRDDDVYRSILGISPIPDELKNSGLEGVNRYADFANVQVNSKLKNTVYRLDDITKRVYVRSKAFEEVTVLTNQAGDMISCVPSVPPIIPEKGKFRISSRFGYRTDPVYGGGEHHPGQDFATKKGSPVYATGDAVVETVEFHFRGYGNTIVLNHGYGYKTRYAHLNTVDVVEGMKVHRGDQIATVGTTGKSTGPHLHYEIIYMGKKLNPGNFMDINMPVEEYMAMILKRGEESTFGKRSSTLELLKGRKYGDE